MQPRRPGYATACSAWRRQVAPVVLAGLCLVQSAVWSTAGADTYGGDGFRGDGGYPTRFDPSGVEARPSSSVERRDLGRPDYPPRRGQQRRNPWALQGAGNHRPDAPQGNPWRRFEEPGGNLQLREPRRRQLRQPEWSQRAPEVSEQRLRRPGPAPYPQSFRDRRAMHDSYRYGQGAVDFGFSAPGPNPYAIWGAYPYGALPGFGFPGLWTPGYGAGPFGGMSGPMPFGW